MIETYEQAYAIINRDPEVDPAVFWPTVGMTEEVAREVGKRGLAVFRLESPGVTFQDVMASMEIGATLAREYFETRIGTCQARRVHPLSSDFYVSCVLDESHAGDHSTIDGCQWTDDSPYAIARDNADDRANPHHTGAPGDIT